MQAMNYPQPDRNKIKAQKNIEDIASSLAKITYQDRAWLKSLGIVWKP